jgi:hypothetical protein
MAIMGYRIFPKLYDWNNTEQYVAITQEALNAKNAQARFTAR